MNIGKVFFWPFFFCAVLFSCQKKAYQPASAALAAEPHRPNFHFTPPANWMNDPNGMVYFEGEWHLFYQHYPEATVWGPMHWGHAVSRDLVRWEHLPIALYPDSLGLIFSGSTVVDWQNTSKFGLDGKPPLVSIFTQHLMEGEKAGRTDFQYQSIAFSNDKGRNWTKYAGNPVVPNTQKIRDFRDPKVIWDETSRQWLMVFAANDHVKFWASPDLKNWKHLSDFGKGIGAHGGVWECPDFFPITVENTTEKRWVLLLSLNPGSPNGGSGTQYFVGSFDGKNFTLDPDFQKTASNERGVWLDFGRDNYAGVTWADVPQSDGRRIFMGWMSNWDYATLVPTEKWRSATTLPRELILGKTDAGLRLKSQPVTELKKLRRKPYTMKAQLVEGRFDLSEKSGISPSGMEILLDVDFSENTKADFSLVLSNAKGEEYRIGFDAVKSEFYSDRMKSGKRDFSKKFAEKRHIAPRYKKDKRVRLHLFLDVASCELFADDGETAITDVFFPTEDFNKISIVTANGPVKIQSCKAYPLNAAQTLK